MTFGAMVSEACANAGVASAVARIEAVRVKVRNDGFTGDRTFLAGYWNYLFCAADKIAAHSNLLRELIPLHLLWD